MPSIKATLILEADNHVLPGFPLVRRVQVNSFQEFNYNQTNDGLYDTLPVTALTTLNMLLVSPQAAMSLRLNGQTAAGFTLNPNGLLLILDGTLNAGASTNATINNSGTAAAQVSGFAGGTP